MWVICMPRFTDGCQLLDFLFDRNKQDQTPVAISDHTPRGCTWKHKPNGISLLPPILCERSFPERQGICACRQTKHRIRYIVHKNCKYWTFIPLAGFAHGRIISATCIFPHGSAIHAHPTIKSIYVSKEDTVYIYLCIPLCIYRTGTADLSISDPQFHFFPRHVRQAIQGSSNFNHI